MSETKSKIDQIRESAGSFEINTPDDDSDIAEMISVGERLLIVKGKGIFEVKLADQIDPVRTNINTPNTVQKIIPFGADHPWVGKVILTPNKLFNKEFLENHINCSEAMVRIFNIAEDVAALHELEIKFQKDLLSATKGYDLQIKKDRSVIIPAINNVEVRCNEFLQKADHALAELFKIINIFFPDVRKGGWDSLKKKIEEGPKGVDNFKEFLDNSVPFLHLVRNARNCVEHPLGHMKIVATDFSVGLQSNLLPPLLEIIHPKTPFESTPVTDFFQFIYSNIIEIIELMIVFICARNIKSTSRLPILVSLLPEVDRRSPNVRYGYTMNIGGQTVPMS